MGRDARLRAQENSMTRRFTVTKDQGDICWTALCVGRLIKMRRDNGDKPQPQSPAERRQDRNLTRKFKDASTEADPKEFPMLETGDRQRVFGERTTLDLTQPEHTRLIECLNAMTWQTSKLDNVCDLEDVLDGAEKVEEAK